MVVAARQRSAQKTSICARFRDGGGSGKGDGRRLRRDGGSDNELMGAPGFGPERRGKKALENFFAISRLRVLVISIQS